MLANYYAAELSPSGMYIHALQITSADLHILTLTVFVRIKFTSKMAAFYNNDTYTTARMVRRK